MAQPPYLQDVTRASAMRAAAARQASARAVAEADADAAIAAFMETYPDITQAPELKCVCGFVLDLDYPRKERLSALKTTRWARGVMKVHCAGGKHLAAAARGPPTAVTPLTAAALPATGRSPQDTPAAAMVKRARYDTAAYSSSSSSAPASSSNASSPAASSGFAKCSGYGLPQFGANACLTFPWQLVAESPEFEGVAVCVSRTGMTAFANDCARLCSSGSSMCSACALKHLDRLDWSGLAEVAQLASVSSTSLLSSLPDDDALRTSLAGARDRAAASARDQDAGALADSDTMWNSIRSYIATGDVARVRAQLLQLQKRHAAPFEVLDHLRLAAIRAMRARGVTTMDGDMRTLILRIGGPRLLNAVTSALAPVTLDSESRHGGSRPPHRFIPTTHADTLSDDVKANAAALALSEAGADDLPIVVVAVADTAIRRGVRYHASSDSIVGTCIEHSKRVGHDAALQMSGASVAAAVHTAVAVTDLHVASDISLFVVSDASRDGTSAPVAAMCSCMRASAVTQSAATRVLHACMAALPRSFPAHSLRVFATSGDLQRRAVMRAWFYSEKVFNTVDGVVLRGVDLPVPVRGYAFDVGFIDWLHMITRFRSALLRAGGIKANGCAFDSEWCNSMLSAAGVHPARITTVLDSEDVSNVPSAVELLRALVTAADAAAVHLRHHSGDSDPQRLGLVLLGIVIRPYLAVILPAMYTPPGTGASLSVLLQTHCALFAASAVASAVLFHAGGAQAAFLPSIMYHDVQHNAMMVLQFCNKIHAWLRGGSRAVTTALALLGTNGCEDIFSTVRGDIYDPDCDAVQFATRITAALDVAALFDGQPPWKRQHRRAVDSNGDDVTLKRLEAAARSIGSTLTIRSMHVEHGMFSPRSAWTHGCNDVTALLASHRSSTDASVWSDPERWQLAVMQLPSFMRRPDGTFIAGQAAGVTAETGSSIDREVAELTELLDAERDDYAANERSDVSSADIAYELVDAAGNGGLSLPHDTHCTLNGRRVSKASIVNSLFGDLARRQDEPVDRLLRFEASSAVNAPFSATGVHNLNVVAAAASPVVAVLLHANDSVIVCLARVAQIRVVHASSGKETAVESVGVAFLHDDRVRLTVTLLSTVTNGTLICCGASTGSSITVSGAAFMLFDIAAANVQYGPTKIVVPIGSMRAAAEMIWKRIVTTSSGNKLAAVQRIPQLPVQVDAPWPTWHTVKASPTAEAVLAHIVDARLKRCKCCGSYRRNNSLRLHVAAHMLQRAIAGDASINTMCGLCGSDGQKPDGACVLAVDDGALRSLCSHATAAADEDGFKATQWPRCTNDLLLCSMDGCGAPLFRYAASWHLRTVHHADFGEHGIATQAEREYVMNEGAQPRNSDATQRAALPVAAGVKRHRDGSSSSVWYAAGVADGAASSSATAALAAPALEAQAQAASAAALAGTDAFKWSVYANTNDYKHDFALLVRHLRSGEREHAAAVRDTMVTNLRATAARLGEAVARLGADGEGDLDEDVGIDASTQRESMQLHMAQHLQIADDLARRNFHNPGGSAASATSQPRAPGHAHSATAAKS